eukprot:COSAG02_NODE_53539_length_301_cov_0.747525_1_plen_54_part_10
MGIVAAGSRCGSHSSEYVPTIDTLGPAPRSLVFGILAVLLRLLLLTVCVYSVTL